MLRFLALWLAALAAFATPSTARLQVGRGVGGVVALGGSGEVRSGGGRVVDDGVRQAEPVRLANVTRTAPSGGATHQAPLATVPRIAAAVVLATLSRALALDASHVVPARGALLPYYPTAPPLQG